MGLFVDEVRCTSVTCIITITLDPSMRPNHIQFPGHNFLLKYKEVRINGGFPHVNSQATCKLQRLQLNVQKKVIGFSRVVRQQLLLLLMLMYSVFI